MGALVAAVLGAGAGVGFLLILAGVTGRRVLVAPQPCGMLHRLASGIPVSRLAPPVAAAVVAAAVTGWLAGAVLVGAAVLAAPRVIGGKRDRQAAVARTEAVAAWTEMVRDSIAAAAGLEEAITATAPVAPEPIRAEVALLVRRLRHASLPVALAAFGDDVDHPSADLVVAALTIAATMEASDLTGLLSRLAEAIRGEARMRVRVEVDRARLRTATKIILGVVAASIALLALFNPDYLDAYDGPLGQVVLLVIGAIFATGGWLLVRMAELELPARFSARSARSRS